MQKTKQNPLQNNLSHKQKNGTKNMKKKKIHVLKETSPLTENPPFCKITHKRNSHLAKKLSFYQKKKNLC